MNRSEYRLRGRFASRDRYAVPKKLLAHRREDQALPPSVQPPRWISIAAFLFISMATLFAMCAVGNPGA